MNRHDKRASDSVARRTGEVSPALLQKTLIEVDQQRQALQDLLYAIVRAQGRVRVSKADMAALNQNMRLDVREVGDDFYLSIEQSMMVVEGGVKDGKTKGHEPGGAA